MKRSAVPCSRCRGIIICALTVLAPVSVIASSFFVDAGSGVDDNDGRSPSTAWRTISKVNSTTFQPGDTIAFKRGGVWRERLVASSSGSAGNPVLYTAFGSGPLPTISGADPVSGWQSVQGIVYRAILADEPYQLYVENERLKRNRGAGSEVVVGEWDWNRQFIYVNVGLDPSTVNVEATRGNWSGQHGVIVSDRDHVTLDSLHITRFRVNVFVSGNNSGSDWFALTNCRLSDAYYHGIQGWDQTHPNDDVTISHNEVINSGGSGINWTKFGDRGVISHNTVTENCQLTNEETGSGEHTYSAGIYLFGNRVGISNIVIEHNTVQSCGTGLIPGDFAGAGIWVDQTLGGNIVRYNVVSGNTNSGIVAEDTPLGGMIYYNVVFDNGKGVQPLDGYGIFLSRDSQYWQVYNNTVFDNRIGLCVADWLDDGPPQNNIFTNNIVYASETTELIVLHGSESLLNVFTHNDLDEGHDFIRWGNATYDDLAGWQAGALRVHDNLSGDPIFVHSSGHDFRLSEGSPCAHTGTTVGIATDIIGAPVSEHPSIGAYEVPIPISTPRRVSGRYAP